MKGYLFDENVPRRLTIAASFPVVHCLELGQKLSDTFLWEHAQANDYVIITKDADFSNRIMLSTPPPWIVHLRIGNMRKREFHAFLERIWPEVESLLPAHKLVSVHEDRIEAVG